MLVRSAALTGLLALRDVRAQTLHPCHSPWNSMNYFALGARVSHEVTTTSPDTWASCDPADPIEYDCPESGLKNAGGRTTTTRSNYVCVNEDMDGVAEPGTPGGHGWTLEGECDSLPLPTNFVRVSHWTTERYLALSGDVITTNADAPSEFANSFTLQRRWKCPTEGYYADKGLTSPCYLIIWEGLEGRRIYAMTGQEWRQGFGVRTNTEITSEDIWFLEQMPCKLTNENSCAMLRNAVNGRSIYNNPDPDMTHIISASPGGDYQYHWTGDNYIWYFEDLNTNTWMDVSPWASNTMYTRTPTGATSGGAVYCIVDCTPPDYLEIGNWRLARVGASSGAVSHFSISSDNIQTSQIFKYDGTVHPGPRTDYNGWDMEDPTGLASPTNGIVFGFKGVQVRDWRIKQIDARHLSVSHESGNVSRIYRDDGNVFGNNMDYSGYNGALGEPTCAYLTDFYLQIGDWRIAMMDANHLSVSHNEGMTAMIYRADGTIHPGPRTDFNGWGLPDGQVIMGSSDGC